jgi:hypothetical protein
MSGSARTTTLSNLPNACYVKKMKTYKILLTFAVVVATFSLLACNASGGDDDEDTVQVVFKDQTLQGEFNGKTYTFVSVYAEESYFTEGESISSSTT